MLHSRHFECTVERGVYWAGCLRIEIQLYTMFIQLGIYLMTVFGEHETSIFTRVFRLKPSSPQGFIHSSKRHKKSELTWQVVFLHEERTRIDTCNWCGGLLIKGNSKKLYSHEINCLWTFWFWPPKTSGSNCHTAASLCGWVKGKHSKTNQSYWLRICYIQEQHAWVTAVWFLLLELESK